MAKKCGNVCYLKFNNHGNSYKALSDLSEIEVKLVLCRSGVELAKRELLTSTICYHFYAYLVINYVSHCLKGCINVFSTSKSKAAMKTIVTKEIT